MTGSAGPAGGGGTRRDRPARARRPEAKRPGIRKESRGARKETHRSAHGVRQGR